MKALNSMFFLALQEQVTLGNIPLSEFQSRVKGAVPKGGIPHWEKRFWSRSGRTFSEGMRVLKIRKKLARLYEFKRLLVSADSGMQTKDALQNLARKLRLVDVSFQGLPVVVQLITEVKQELRDTETETRKQKLKKWREHITNDHKELGRWLRARDRPNVAAVSFQNQTFHQPKDISKEIIGFWERFWERSGFDNSSEQVLDTFGVSSPPDALVPPSLESLIKIFRSKEFGTSGGDGWKGCELKHIPVESIHLFRILALKWEDSLLLPEEMFHARMVNLPKNKVENGVLAEQNIRPITVLNVFWRVWGSAWIRTPQVNDWIRHLPSDIIFGKGSDAAVGAAELFSHLPEFGYGGTLDYAKAYDSMHPKGTTLLMKKAGWPEGISELIGKLWSNQIRWVSWGGHYHHNPMYASPCTPQGCPFGPVALALWMSAGTAYVRHQVGQDFFCRTYMDDRSFLSSSPQGLLDCVSSWAEWISLVGLRESPGKTQLVGLGARRHDLLKEAADRLGYAGSVFKDITILGSTSAFAPRGCSPKELDRLGAACRTVTLICSIRFSTALFQLKSRVYAVSKLLYGWISRIPPAFVSDKIWTLLRGRTQQAANKYLRAILHGGLCHVDCLAGVVLCRVVSCLRDRGLAWAEFAPRGTPLGALQGWFRARGFGLVSPWVWSRGSAVTEVSLRGGSPTR